MMTEDNSGPGGRSPSTALNETPLSLLDRLRRGPDESSWQRFFGLYQPLIQGWLRRHGVVEADIDDIVQEVLAAVAHAIPEFQHAGHKGAFRSWLRRIAIHRTRHHWRSQGSRIQADAAQDLDDLADPDDELGRLWDQEHDAFIIRRLMELIEPEFARATWASFYRQVIEGRSAAEVAAELGLSTNAVLIAKSRVLRRIRREAHGLVDELR
jgi:RNA polymerase sigma factor (sigma-70 family)